MAVNILKTSRLSFSTLRSVSGVEFWELQEPVIIPVQDDDLMYIVQERDRLDTISQAFYATPFLGWVIAVANELRIPDIELQRGMEIRIPSGRYVFGVLLNR
jgi:hypothetical protein